MKAFLRTLAARCLSCFQRRRLEAEMAEEMRAHLDVLTEENIASGMTSADARLAARKRFGGVAQIEERCRDERRFVWLEQLAGDVRFSFRSLCRARAFTGTVVGTLTLGIGVATAVFILTAWVTFYASPFPHAEQLFVIGSQNKQTPFVPYRVGLFFQAYQEQTTVFTEYAAAKREVSNIVIGGEPVAGNVINVSADFLHTLGIQPVLGRGFRPEDYRGADAGNVVIITDLFWRRHLNADPAVLGRTIRIDQQVSTVIGVFRQTQAFPRYFGGDVYRPLYFVVDPQQVFDPTLFIIGRLRDGITPTEAETALSSVRLPTIPQWATAYFSEQRPALLRLDATTSPGTYWLIAVAAGFLFAIACLNAMNLMLVRLLGRSRELSIRLALGGTRWQIARLVLIESVGLAVTASVVVILAVRWLFPRLFVLLDGNDDALYQSFLNWSTLGCIVSLSIVASVGIVLVPVFRLLKTEINAGLKEGGSSLGETPRMRRIRNLLVVLQAAMAVILLAGTGLMMRTFQRIHQVDLGFDPVGKVKVQVVFPRGFEPPPEARLQIFERLRDRLRSIPGVKDVATGQDSLLMGGFWGTAQLLMRDGTFRPVAGNFVSADYPKTAGLMLKKGRWFSGKRGVVEAVINETMARERFGDADPIGQLFKIQVSGDMGYPVVGVVRDVKATVRASDGMHYYVPDWMYPPNTRTLLLRLDRDPEKAFAGVVRRAIYEFDPKIITADVNSINSLVGYTMQAEHYAYTILKGLSIIALGLAVIGLFSVIAYTVDMRMKEFGVRLALGARPGNLHRLVMKRGLVTAATGVVIGIAGGLTLTRFMQSLLFETTAHDPLVYGAVAAILLAAAAIACWLPARRAARVDITKLLRTE